MVFSSTIFLFGFLPLILFLYYISPKVSKNIVLLSGSLIFYAWGEVFYVLVMISSIIFNYVLGIFINRPSRKKIYLSVGVIGNLILLGTFKYANFIIDNFNSVLNRMNLDSISIEPVHLPIGISFFTFHSISYLVDVYRRKSPAQKNIFDFALYISLFPQLIAGPIIRYHDIASQIINRSHSIILISSGIQRFVFGLAKKMLIANPLGEVADKIFALPADRLSSSITWLGILCYTLQIYFDFSGYSDMAIGLARMFGFHLLENFNYPYISKSIQEFWRRWHISLSTWFRDYLYIPLGGNRVSPSRVYFNLFLVFILCGLWHGASWNFIVWGLIHGLFLITERVGFTQFLEKLWRPIRHGYAMIIVATAWVFFRSDTISFALHYVSVMFGINNPSRSFYTIEMFLTNEVIISLLFGIMFATPLYSFISENLKLNYYKNHIKAVPYYYAPKMLLICILLFISILKVTSSTYSPFLYFRF
ncbi:MAG: MBOAT family protein [Nitrospiraceae bacterium]|nr:MAG: MBOAT family protein [Nitrospiraceae bacterium]